MKTTKTTKTTKTAKSNKTINKSFKVPTSLGEEFKYLVGVLGMHQNTIIDSRMRQIIKWLLTMRKEGKINKIFLQPLPQYDTDSVSALGVKVSPELIANFNLAIKGTGQIQGFIMTQSLYDIVEQLRPQAVEYQKQLDAIDKENEELFKELGLK